MKQVKRIFALALAVMMIMSLAVTAFAAEGDTETYTVTINNATGHTYLIYQIFTGDLHITKDENGNKVEFLSNVKYGADYGTEGEEVPDSVLEDLVDPTTITPTGAGTAMTVSGDTATATGLVAGYYMIKDTSTGLPEGETTSAVIFQVVEDTTVTSKHTGTTIVKKVQDINDSTGVQPKDGDSVWIDSADYDIGDKVPFKSTAHFEGMANYDTYKVIFTDIMAPGLEYNGDMKVYVDETDRTSAFKISFSDYDNDEDPEYDGGTEITVTCEDIKLIEGVDNDAQIVLEYSATLDNDAKLGAPGNPNKIRVKTIPDGEGGNETPWDVNIVFTYKLNTNKYANQVGEGNELNGAGFTLFKWIKNNSEAGGEWKQIGDEVVGEEDFKFAWTGIDDGKYKLVETTTPAGYNTIDPIEFVVTADHEVVSADPELTDLTGTATTGEVTFTANETNGTVSTDVVNKAGVVLPETGGIGTTIFYVLGGIMVLAAVVLLVTKKRMASAE